MPLVAVTAIALAAGTGLALSALVARPAPVWRVLYFAASAIAAVFAAGAAVGRTAEFVQVGSMGSFALVIAALAVAAWRSPADSDGDDEGGGHDGPGGGRPPRPRGPEPEPSWWPAFEREFRLYAAACADIAFRARARSAGLSREQGSGRD